MAGTKFFERSTIRPLRELLRAAWSASKRLAGLEDRGRRRLGRRGMVRRKGRSPEGSAAPVGSGPPRADGDGRGGDGGDFGSEPPRRAQAEGREDGADGAAARLEQAMVARIGAGSGEIAGSYPGHAALAGASPEGQHPGPPAWDGEGLPTPTSVEPAVVVAPGGERAVVGEWRREPGGWDEALGELPWAYQDDSFLALPRDPTTLWLMWDFSPSTVEAARRGIEDPRVRLRVFAEDELVREVDLALESGSFYLHDLPPGRRYRAELWVVGRNGAQRLGAPANEVGLPRRGPSPRADDRFATLPWGLPLDPGLDLFAQGMSLAELSGAARGALYAASRPGRRLGGSESLVGASPNGRDWFSGAGR